MTSKDLSNDEVSPYEWNFVERIEELGSIGAEGFQLRVSDRDQMILGYDHHHTYKIYDLASLTKVLFTTHEVMRLVDEKRLRLSDSVKKHLDWYPFDIEVGELLNHTSGLLWWKPFYQQIDLKLGVVEKRLWLQKELSLIKPSASKKAVYSDINFLILGFLIEEIRQLPLLECFEKLKMLGVHGDMHFRQLNFVDSMGGSAAKPSSSISNKDYAPTEKCTWRKKVIRAEVHDDNTWSLGGVSSHAGLFGSIDDVHFWGNQLLRAHQGRKNNFGVTTSTVQGFTKRSIPTKIGDWGFGFMKPTLGSCSGGDYLSPQSFGHTGFTGVSLWVDPKIERVITLLSNRVHPTRENKIFVTQRPKIHNSIWLAKEAK